jgi:putative ATPase
MKSAKAAVMSGILLEVPMHLRNAPVKAMRDAHGYGKGYQYPHNSEGGVVSADYFPIGFTGEKSFYEPSDRGFEQEVRERMENAKKILAKQ